MRHERSRKPVVHTKAMDAFVAAQPLERARKEREERWHRGAAERARRWWALMRRPRKIRKPRTKYGHTFWTHSLDV